MPNVTVFPHQNAIIKPSFIDTNCKYFHIYLCVYVIYKKKKLKNNFRKVLAKECIKQNMPKLNVVVSNISHAIVFE